MDKFALASEIRLLNCAQSYVYLVVTAHIGPAHKEHGLNKSSTVDSNSYVLYFLNARNFNVINRCFNILKIRIENIDIASNRTSVLLFMDFQMFG